MENHIPLNSSVAVEDEARLSNQAQQILQYFREARRLGMKVTTRCLTRIAAQYNARLYEVRRYLIPQGFCIDLVRGGPDGNNEYQMVPLDQSKFYTKHRHKF